MIQNLIWDVDGTLFDTYPAIVQALQQALAAHNRWLPEPELEAMAKVSVSRSVVELARRFGLDEAEFGEAFDSQYRAIPKESQAPFEGVRAVCQKTIALGGGNHIVTHRGLRSTQALLALHDLSQYFGEIAAGDQGYPSKPDPAAFLAIVEKCGLDPARTAAVGDREIDIQAGQAAGLKTAWFHGKPDRLAPDLLFDDYRALFEFLTR